VVRYESATPEHRPNRPSALVIHALKRPALKCVTVPSDCAREGSLLMMMDMSTMPIGMWFGMGLIWLLVIVFLALAIAAAIKYLRS
jgi:hypothetical protein